MSTIAQAAFERLVNDMERLAITTAHDVKRDIGLVRSALLAGHISVLVPTAPEKRSYKIGDAYGDERSAAYFNSVFVASPDATGQAR